MRSLFVTGTDTGVGKTVLTAAICAVTGATPMKPVQTGAVRADDLAFVEMVTGRRVPRADACPYRFDEPLAPAVAARRAGTVIDVEVIEQGFRTLSAGGTVVVEGAGGILVEVTEGFTMGDLAARLGLPAVVACRPGLGTLNHSALTIEAAQRRGVTVAGLVIVGWDPAGLAEATNPAELARLAPLGGAFPVIAGLDTEQCRPGALAGRAKEFLAPALGGTFDPATFLARLS